MATISCFVNMEIWQLARQRKAQKEKDFVMNEYSITFNLQLSTFNSLSVFLHDDRTSNYFRTQAKKARLASS